MDMQMAERLVARRKAAGYSQEALAAELGVSRQAVSKWERGEASPDTDNLIALAGLYGVTLDELLFGKASPDPKDAGEKNENPAKSQVRISLREGIHVVDPKGEEVHVGWDGIHASDAAGNTVESDPEGEGVTINGTHYDSWHDAHEELGHDLKGKSDFRRRWDAFPFPALVLVAYLAVGWATGQWVVALLLGYLVPLYYMVGAALGGEEPFSLVSGAWPLLATAYYVWKGIFFDRWGSAWLVLRLTMPQEEWGEDHGRFGAAAAERGTEGTPRGRGSRGAL